MAIKKLRKKGIFLTFIAIALIAAIIIIFTPSGINLYSMPNISSSTRKSTKACTTLSGIFSIFAVSSTDIFFLDFTNSYKSSALVLKTTLSIFNIDFTNITV